MMITVFDKPQWSWRRSYEKKTHAGLHNVVDLFNTNSNAAISLVIVPAGFINYLLTIGGLTFDRLEEVGMYLKQDQSKPKYWVFGYSTPAGGDINLWRYSRKNVPPWLAEGHYDLLNECD